MLKQIIMNITSIGLLILSANNPVAAASAFQQNGIIFASQVLAYRDLCELYPKFCTFPN